MASVLPLYAQEQEYEEEEPQLAPQTITFASDQSWGVFQRSATYLTFQGFAEEVCLNDASPLNCPATAVRYGYAGFGWLADRRNGAQWIWAPGTTGDTAPADLAEFFFVKAFYLRGTPLSGNISIAADDFAEIYVNGQSVGTWGSTTDIAVASVGQTLSPAFDITSRLRRGLNVIAVRGKNGPASFAGVCGGSPCTYSQNPAGVEFSGSLTYQPLDD
jgi:hypothetical protein